VIKFIRAWIKWRGVESYEPSERPNVVFNYISMFGQKRYEKNRDVFLSSPVNVLRLTRKKNLSDCLENYKNLSTCPKGSFGRAFFEFMSAEEVDYAKFLSNYQKNQPSGLVEETPLAGLMKEHHRWEKDVHDIIHVVFGYSRSRFGEGATIATHYFQGGAAGMIVLFLFGSVRVVYKRPSALLTMIRVWIDIYWRQRGVDLRSYPFEDNLEKPLEEIRLALGVRPPTKSINTCERHTTWSKEVVKTL
jgi:ubiquinone biosynthesis protein Coq4